MIDGGTARRGSAVLLAVFGVLAACVAAGWTMGIDRAATSAAIANRTALLNEVAVNVTALGSALVSLGKDALDTAKALVAQQAGPHYPAPVKAVELMEKAATDSRDAALEKEALAFAALAKSPEAAGLVQIFHGDQFLKKKA